MTFSNKTNMENEIVNIDVFLSEICRVAWGMTKSLEKIRLAISRLVESYQQLVIDRSFSRRVAVTSSIENAI